MGKVALTEMAFWREEMAHGTCWGWEEDGARLMLRDPEACEVAGLSC